MDSAQYINIIQYTNPYFIILMISLNSILECLIDIVYSNIKYYWL